MELFSFGVFLKQITALMASLFIVLGLVWLLFWVAMGFNIADLEVSIFILMLINQYGSFETTQTRPAQSMTFAQFFKTELAGPTVALVAVNSVYVMLCATGMLPWSLLYGFFIAPLGLFSYYYGLFMGINRGWTLPLAQKMVDFFK